MYFVLASSNVLFNVFQNDVQSQNYIFSETEKIFKNSKNSQKIPKFSKNCKCKKINNTQSENNLDDGKWRSWEEEVGVCSLFRLQAITPTSLIFLFSNLLTTFHNMILDRKTIFLFKTIYCICTSSFPILITKIELLFYVCEHIFTVSYSNSSFSSNNWCWFWYLFHFMSFLFAFYT